ncbi:MAG: archaeosortase/exosortase family protein, partial [Leptolyngbyaceae bacterium]|nr:archaeosortase/exosortase family protein [Leptolyngbyaceae bacterium]
LFLLSLRTSFLETFLVPIVAVTLGFFVNGVRVALMAWLVSYSSHSNFEYWHSGSGAQIFALISYLGFGGFCHWLVQRRGTPNPPLQASVK